MKEEIHKCQCHTHGFSVTPDKELGVVFMYSWAYGKAGEQLRWRDRLRWAWRVLSTGQPWDDEIVLDAESAKELGARLQAAAQEAKP